MPGVRDFLTALPPEQTAERLPAGERGGQGLNPGGIEALRNGIQYLMKFMSPEEILSALLDLAREKGIDISEEQIRQIMEQVGAGEAAGGAPQGAPMAQPMPPEPSNAGV